MRVSVNAMTVSPRQKTKAPSSIYRHRYRQFLRLQGGTREHPHALAAILLSVVQMLASDGGRLRATANDCVAGELGFEPRQTESESVVLPLHHSPRYLNSTRYLRSFLAVPAMHQANRSQACVVLLAP